jgi:hypothetical protein
MEYSIDVWHEYAKKLAFSSSGLNSDGNPGNSGY